MRRIAVAFLISACLSLVALSTFPLATRTASASQTCTARCNNGTTVSCTGTVSCQGIAGFGCVSHNKNLPDYIVECPDRPPLE